MSVELNSVNFWIQAYDVPIGLMSKRIAMDIGNYIGSSIESDPRNFDGTWKVIIRIQTFWQIMCPCLFTWLRASNGRHQMLPAHHGCEILPWTCLHHSYMDRKESLSQANHTEEIAPFTQKEKLTKINPYQSISSGGGNTHFMALTRRRRTLQNRR